MRLAGKRSQAAHGSLFLPCAAGRGTARSAAGGARAGSSIETTARWMTPSTRGKGGENFGRGRFHRAWRGPLPRLAGEDGERFCSPLRRDRFARLRQAAAHRLAQSCAPTSWRCGSPTRTSSSRSPGCRRTRATPTWRTRPRPCRPTTATPRRRSPTDPDLVLVGPFADRASIALLKQVGAPVVEVRRAADARRRAPADPRPRRRARRAASAARRWSPTWMRDWRAIARRRRAGRG